MKFAIVYLSFSGNTEKLATMIKTLIELNGYQAHLFSTRDDFNLENYDYVLFGSLTWENKGIQGKLPVSMRKLLKKILIDEPQLIKRCSLFGTGETQWGAEYFCRGVDEMEYHLAKHNTPVDAKLKIEQNPIGKEMKVKHFVKEIMKEVEIIEN